MALSSYNGFDGAVAAVVVAHQGLKTGLNQTFKHYLHVIMNAGEHMINI